MQNKIISSVYCSFDGFKEIDFIDGFNVVIADKHDKSTEKDSRNGLGKSTLIEIVHFCLGAQYSSLDTISNKIVKGWQFFIDIYTPNGDFLQVCRIANKGSGFVEIFPYKLSEKTSLLLKDYSTLDGKYNISIEAWNNILGEIYFNLSNHIKYDPTFRMLFSFVARKGLESFTDAFKTYAIHQEWTKQLTNTFLLGANWVKAAEFQSLKDKESIIREIKRAADAEFLKDIIGNAGELRAKEVRLQNEIYKLEESLRNFVVHPEYSNIQKEANELTKQIHVKLDEKALNEELMKMYQKTLTDEKNTDDNFITTIYEEAGFIFSNITIRRLDEVNAFHDAIISNRRSYLSTEIASLELSVKAFDNDIKILDSKRAELLNILKTHGALDEYTKLQVRLTEKISMLNRVKQSIENANLLATKKTELEIEKKTLLLESRRDYDESLLYINEAIALFNRFSESLYSSSGILAIDIKDSGYIFDVEIERSGSGGIEKMKIFCYDLVLAVLRTKRNMGIKLLIHDSAIFDGVDERQIAKALQLAYDVSMEYGFQYICSLNSDAIPYSFMDNEFKALFKKHIVKTLTDEDDKSGLLGIRF